MLEINSVDKYHCNDLDCMTCSYAGHGVLEVTKPEKLDSIIGI